MGSTGTEQCRRCGRFIHRVRSGFWEDNDRQMVCPAILGGGPHNPVRKENTLRKIGAGRLAEIVARQLRNAPEDSMHRLRLDDIEWGVEDQASGTRGFQATLAGTGQRFEFTVREVTPDPEGLPVRYYEAGSCYGNSDPEVRVAALRKAAEAFPGSELEIWGPYNLYDAVPGYEELQGHGYAGEKYTASTIKVKATG